MEEEYKNQTVENNVSNTESKPKKTRYRMILVISFLIIFMLISYISLKGNYLEFKEIGEQYTEVFWTNLSYKCWLMGINFVCLYFIIYQTNRGIKKGLKPFFEQEKKEMPKLPNKSLALVISAIVSVIITIILMPKIILFMSNASFGEITDPIFNQDIAYYMFQKPVIEIFIMYFIGIIVGLTVYMAIYYIAVFNIYFDGIDSKMLKESKLMKKVLRNILLIAIGVALMILINTQNILFQTFLKTDEGIELVGAGFTEANIKLWGYRIFSIIIIFATYRAIRNFKKGKTKNVFKDIAIIPGYLVILFLVMVGFDAIFVNSNELDKEKNYIQYNIDYTKNAYNINATENNLENSGTITLEEVEENQNVIDNIPIISKDVVLRTLENTQSGTGYYSYKNASIAKYQINGEERLVYVAPREILNTGRTYNNKTYEYTHGMGEIIVSASSATTSGNVEYIQKDITGKDNKINVTQPRIYFGLETNEIIATNTKNKSEYDYTDDSGNEYTYSYDGKAGLSLNFIDRLILGIRKGDLKLAFSNSITDDSKILINRNVIERAKKVLPYLIYDENPYTVINDEGRIIWVIDAYTVSSNYPYSQYTTIEHDGVREKINYIRNSIKVLVDSFDGTVSYYITDRTDPIAMAYQKIYPNLFKEKDEEIPEDIQEHLVYPQYLYEIQAEMLTIYHNVKPDVLYRADDIWDVARYNNNINSTKSTGNELNSYYTMVKTEDEQQEKLGLIKVYTPNEKQNLISYLVGSVENGNNELKLYKFSADSNIVGPMQLDKQIEQDEVISSEIEALNVSGTRITKEMIIVPINNTVLYVEPIYQVMLNEADATPVLKKVVVASGNKVAIGDNLERALENLLSKYAVDIEVENTDDIDSLINLIIKANNNLTESNENDDWEMMGSDIQRLQSLIKSLEELRNEQEQEKSDESENQNQQNEES